MSDIQIQGHLDAIGFVRRQRLRARIKTFLLTLVIGVDIICVINGFMNQVKDYQAWRENRDKLLYGCGWLHSRYASLAPRECVEFLPLLIPRSPA